MRSTFLGFEVSKRTIQLSQKALDITGGNLSNTHTEGYTRQRVDIGSSYLNKYAYWQTSTSRMSLAGQGSKAFGVNQVRDPYIDKRYRESTCYVAEYSTSADILKEVETVLDNIDNEGLTANLDAFKDALSKYSEKPYSEELASIVRNQAYNITNFLHSYQTDLEDLKESNLEALSATMDKTNDIIREIVDYNKAIVKEYSVIAAGKLAAGESVTASYGPNEMLDARNLLIDELSYMGNITVYDNADGSVRILMNGQEIINGEKYEQLYMKGSSKNDEGQYSSELLRDYYAYGAAVLRWTTGEDANLISGELKSYLDILNGNGVYKTGYQNDSYGIPYYESTIDSFAKTFADFMNEFNGAIDEDGKIVKDRLLFSTKDYNDDTEYYNDLDITAKNIRIADSWMSNATMLGEVQGEDGRWTLSLDGNHINSLIVNMEKQPLKFGDKGDYEGTMYDYLLFISNRIGQNIDYYESQYDSAYATSNALLDSRDAVSGVSETEEGINMMTYQNWYNASSRMMTAMDEALDRLINNTGRVGL